MPTNVCTLVSGPCLIQYKGATIRSKEDVKVDLSLETFDVTNDLYQLVDKRVANQPVKISFTPEGRVADIAVLFPYGNVRLGAFVTPVSLAGAVNTTTNTIAVADTALPAGTPVSFGSTGTLPAPLAAATVYYLSANAAGARTVHASSAAAIAGTGAIDLTTTGTGTLSFVEQWPLVILGNDGTRLTFANAAVTKMPTLTFAATKTLYGDVEFEAFPLNGQAWTTAGSIYTVDTAAFADSGFTPTDIVTQPYQFTWGSAPWTGLYSKNGITIEPSLSLDPVEDDASGVLTRRISSVGFTMKAQPMGPDLAALLTALKLQGAGATRGRSLAGVNLDISGTGLYARLYGAALTGGPAQWATKLDRIGELTWAATRTFNAGVAQPLFAISTSVIP